MGCNFFQRISGLFRGIGYLPPPPGSPDGDIVIMVHGLIRRSGNLRWLGRRINRAGYAVYLYDYPTTTKSIAEHGRDFKAFLEKIAAENPDRKINLVTHSMGGIITREALGHLSAEQMGEGEVLTRTRFGRIVMLAPPHLGSDAARDAIRLLPFTRRIRPLPELSSAADAYIHRVPVPQGLDIGIIAGRFDAQVKIGYTRFPGEHRHHLIIAEHSFIMYLPKVAVLVIRYLREGRFQ